MKDLAIRHGSFSVRSGDDVHRVDVEPDGTARVSLVDGSLEIQRIAADTYRVTADNRSRNVFVSSSGDQRHVFVDGEVFELEVSAAGLRPRRARAQRDELAAPMPARVRELLVESGQTVRAGDVLVKLEAMKMELAIRAPHDGTVVSVYCRVGELVAQGVQLLELAVEPASGTAAL